MSRLKVGDIVIESGTISFAGASAPEPEPAVRTRPSPEKELIARALQRLPARARFIAAAGATLLTTAVVLASPFWIAGGEFPFAAIPLASLGLSLIAAAIAKRYSAGRTPESSINGALLDQRFARLRPLLLETNAANTIEHLAAASGMTERVVMETLAGLQARGELVEELNLENGEWYYTLVRGAIDNAASVRSLPLKERLAAEREKQRSGSKT